VIIKCSSSVKNLKIEHNSIKGVELSNGKIFNAGSVIIATGGASYPATGSTGDGYRLAKTAGHTIIPIHPALVPLETSGNIAAKLEGLNLKNISVSVWKDRKKIAERFGEMVFMQYGISGPVILSLSRQLGKIFENGQRLIFSIDLKPALDYKKLDKRLIRDINDFGNLKFREILRKWLPQKMIPVFIDLLKISSEKVCHQLNSKERKKILLLLKEFKLEVTGLRGFDEAIITAGGVNLKEIDPKTMKSKLVNNLYFTGEVLDMDADTGGYNLQIAFSTGWLAGKSVVK
jgi:predicted Rossmann fold flavoprotein